jgi:hypothetical protein
MSASERLLRTNVLAGFIPLLIATRLKFPNDAGKYQATVDLCEVYAFRVYRLLGRRANAGHSALFRTASQLYAGAITHDQALEQVRQTLLYYCPSSAFERAFTDPEAQGNWYLWTGIKYLLYEYEAHLVKDDAIGIKWREVERVDREKTIEHILPQTPTAPYWTSHFTPEEIESSTNDLGNLVLTTHNSSYGNRPFPAKKGEPGSSIACYAISPLRSEQALAAYADWTPQTIVERRAKIVGWALDRWAVEDSGQADEELLDAEDEEAAEVDVAAEAG